MSSLLNMLCVWSISQNSSIFVQAFESLMLEIELRDECLIKRPQQLCKLLSPDNWLKDVLEEFFNDNVHYPLIVHLLCLWSCWTDSYWSLFGFSNLQWVRSFIRADIQMLMHLWMQNGSSKWCFTHHPSKSQFLGVIHSSATLFWRIKHPIVISEQ